MERFEGLNANSKRTSKYWGRYYTIRFPQESIYYIFYKKGTMTNKRPMIDKLQSINPALVGRE